MEERYYIYHKDQLKLIVHYVLLFLLAFMLISFAGCGSDSSTSTNPPPDNNPDDPPTDTQGPNDVWMEGSSFNVANLEIEAGTTVTWTNKSSMDHTVTSGSRGGDDEGDLFDSGTIAPGGTFTFTFPDAGTYAYFCKLHPGMDAEVTVTE